MKARFPFVAVSLLVVSAVEAAAEPVIDDLSPRALRIGAVTQLTISGTDLSGSPQLLLPLEIASQKLESGSNAARAVFSVELPDTAAPGIYPLRLVTESGISPVILVGVDDLPQQAFAEKLESLPVALTGNLTGGTVLRTEFGGRQGQQIVVDLEARRLSGKLNPVLRLLDPRGVQIAWSPAIDSAGGDARLAAVLDQDGEHVIELHDALYRGAAPGHFRLKVGALYFADRAFPLAVQRGKTAQVGFAVSNVDETLSVSAPPQFRAAAMPAPWPKLAGLTGSRPSLLISDHAEHVEPPSAEKEHLISPPPVGVSGRIAQPGEEDVFRMPVTPGMKLQFDVMAARAGSPLDAVLSIRRENGAQIAASDDRGDTTDPGLDVTVPGGVEALLVAIKDLAARGGDEFIYRMTAEPVDRPTAKVVAAADRVAVPQAGAALLRVDVQRKGFGGALKLDFGPLPSGMEVQNSLIPAGASRALVSFTAVDGASGQGLQSLSAESGDTANPLIAPVEIAGSGNLPAWARHQIAVAAVAPRQLTVALAGWSAENQLTAGRKLAAKATVQRAATASGSVRLSLLTSQIVPQKKVKQDDKDVMVDDTSRALRLEQPVTLAADAGEAELSILVPADLPRLAYDVAVRAELLSADGKQVLAAAVTPARRLNVADPPAEAPLAVFEDQRNFPDKLTEGDGAAAVEESDKHAGEIAVKVTGVKRAAASLPGLGVMIREFPAAGEYRYLRFAWKKQGGQAVCLELNHDGKWGPENKDAPPFRYHAGPAAQCFDGSLAVAKELPGGWTVVTRDLYRDFGEFKLGGLSLAPVDGEFALFDDIYLGRSPVDFDPAGK